MARRCLATLNADYLDVFTSCPKYSVEPRLVKPRYICIYTNMHIFIQRLLRGSRPCGYDLWWSICLNRCADVKLHRCKFSEPSGYDRCVFLHGRTMSKYLLGLLALIKLRHRSHNASGAPEKNTHTHTHLSYNILLFAIC